MQRPKLPKPRKKIVFLMLLQEYLKMQRYKKRKEVEPE